MSTASARATAISRYTTHMRILLVLIVMLAGCAQTPRNVDPQSCAAAGACPACPQCPPLKPAPETARYQEVPFDVLPGWASVALEPSLRAFLASCPRPGTLARACELARAAPS